jgi:beta-glucanase (GH16 family)
MSSGSESKVTAKNATSGNWETVWIDEFDGDELDRTKWKPEESCWGGGNNERQCYTDRPENVSFQDGILYLQAQEEEFTGPNLPEGLWGAPDGERTQAYTSGKIRTRGLASWQYGRFSARLKLPEGQGTWPAFWMMSADDTYGPWPLSGEIDIMEAVNLETPCSECPGGIERRTSGALHFGDAIPNNTYLYLNREVEDEVGPSNEWRVYTVEWAQDAMQWFVDGEIFMRIESDDWFTKAPEANGRPYAPFDQPFYMMLNLAVGGNLAEKKNGGGFDPDAFPTALLVDWVKVEQCAGDDTGRACMTSTNWSGTPKGPWETQAR